MELNRWWRRDRIVVTDKPDDGPTLENDLAEVLNKWSIDDEINVPDFILAKYITRNLAALRRMNDEWNEHIEKEG